MFEEEFKNSNKEHIKTDINPIKIIIEADYQNNI